MSEYLCFLITIYYTDQLIKCAIKAHQDHFPEDVILYPMEPENKEVYRNFLPEHVKNMGPIVDIESIFETIEHTKK